MSSSLRSRSNTFASLELERFAELRANDEWLGPRMRAPHARFLLLRDDGRALVTTDTGSLRELDPAERDRLAGDAEPSYLGHAEGHDHFLVRVDAARADDIAIGLGAGFVSLREVAATWPPFEAGLFAYVLGLANWQARTRFCAACGAPLRLEAAGHRAICTGPHCG